MLGIVEPLFTRPHRDRSPPNGCWRKPWPRLTYQQALDCYGTDKPDLRYELPIVDVTELAGTTGFQVFVNAVASGGVVRGIRAPGAASFTRRQLDELTELVRATGAHGLAWAALTARRAALALRPLPGYRAAEQPLARAMGAGPGDLVLLVADTLETTRAALGRLRIELAQRLNLIPPDVMAWAFVTEFPWFERDATTGQLTFVHHPFTMPFEEDLPLLETDPLKVRARAYDIVCNGEEIASGSIRVHRADIQARLFELLGYSEERIQANFGHMLRAFEYGAPPHGGIAPGIDRIVSLLADEDNIREVIPFPKNQSRAGSAHECARARLRRPAKGAQSFVRSNRRMSRPCFHVFACPA